MLELAKFLGGYLAVLAVPGPNLLAIGGMAALHGLRGAVPLCLGTALGAGVLSATLLFGAAQLGGDEAAKAWRMAGNLAGALLLLCVALLIAHQRPPEPGAALPQGVGAAALGAGFLNAATNPLTGAYFASQFFGPLSGLGTLLAFVPLLVCVAALSFFLTLSGLLARPVFRATVVAWHRPIRLTAAAVLVFMSAFSLGRTLAEIGWRPSGPALAGVVIFMSGFLLGCVSGFVLGRMPGRRRRRPTLVNRIWLSCGGGHAAA